MVRHRGHAVLCCGTPSRPDLFPTIKPAPFDRCMAHTLGVVGVRFSDHVVRESIFVVLLILWLLGFSLHVGGSLIHLLLVVGLVVLVINLLSGRRSAV